MIGEPNSLVMPVQRETASITRDTAGFFNLRCTTMGTKNSGSSTGEVKLFANNARKFRDKEIHQGDVEARFLPLLIMGLVQAGGLFHAIYLFQQGLIEVGDIAAYYGLLGLLGFPTFVSLFAYSQVSLGVAGARRILELINRET